MALCRCLQGEAKDHSLESLAMNITKPCKVYILYVYSLQPYQSSEVSLIVMQEHLYININININIRVHTCRSTREQAQ